MQGDVNQNEVLRRRREEVNSDTYQGMEEETKTLASYNETGRGGNERARKKTVKALGTKGE